MDRPRLHGVDVARGLAVVGMLFVDNRGNSSIGTQFVHAPWHGLRVADVVFPVFLLVVGVSMPFSRRADRPRAVLVRVLKLAVLGVLVVGAKYGFDVVGAGVLGHIAGAYLLCWLLLRLARRAQVPTAAGVLAVLTAVAVLLPVPGSGRTAVEPDLSWAHWFDDLLGLDFSAEAPHSYLPSAITVFLGVLAGRVLLDRGARGALSWIVAGAGVLLVLGLLLAPLLPVNKRLWTPSFVLVTGGSACWCWPRRSGWSTSAGCAGRSARPRCSASTPSWRSCCPSCCSGRCCGTGSSRWSTAGSPT
ncbi:heparan-alpha-glucosaminide N-acetyltransferase domain-containing protein [Klenkia terrae]|uniref:heparan-alpha-glucosaminide N-acetyltransferase domain-containing protein n=1 Tax=Klenkia terrae TaxID=1052259 RepID=UPI00360F780E